MGIIYKLTSSSGKSYIGHHHYGGYAVCNHPILKNKHFTSKKFTDQEKLFK